MLKTRIELSTENDIIFKKTGIGNIERLDDNAFNKNKIDSVKIKGEAETGIIASGNIDAISGGTAFIKFGTKVDKVTGKALSTNDYSNIEKQKVADNTVKDSYPAADSIKVGNISITQPVNLDTMESDIAALHQLTVYANNAAAITGGLIAGALYRTGADPDSVCVVH